MRWKFATEAERAQKLRLIDRWWRAFEEKTTQLDALLKGKEQWDILPWIKDHLWVIDEELGWDFGPGLNGGNRLVITPEPFTHLRPLVQTMLERAPQLAGWEFHAYRLAESIAVAETLLTARNLPLMRGADVAVKAGAHNDLDLIFFAPALQGYDDDEARQAAYRFTEIVLGEQMLETWIHAISVEMKPPAASAIPVTEMRRAVSDHIARIQADFPERPAWSDADSREWTIWELDPVEEPDYPHQYDLVISESAYPPMWNAAHSNDTAFYSDRFSRHGEVFCYVKFDRRGEPLGERGQDREIEEALASMLGGDRIGAVVGNGVGLRHSYIDLALNEPEKSIPRIINLLRERKAPERSWLLFFDKIYSKEWVGAWDHSPPPPGAEFMH